MASYLAGLSAEGKKRGYKEFVYQADAAGGTADLFRDAGGLVGHRTSGRQ